jgi:histone H3/H4
MPAMIRLARRSGIERITLPAIRASGERTRNLMDDVLKTAFEYTRYRLGEQSFTKGNPTVSTMDIVYALKRNGITMYGAEGNVNRIDEDKSYRSSSKKASRR